MNIFSNILKSPTDAFLTKQKEPSFMEKISQPSQAPKTDSYIKPVVPAYTQPKKVEQPKKALTLFSDEQNAYNAMKQDGL